MVREMSVKYKLKRLKEKVKRFLRELDDSIILLIIFSIEPEVVTV